MRDLFDFLKDLLSARETSISLAALAGGITRIISDSLRGDSNRSTGQLLGILFIVVTVGYFTVDLATFLGADERLSGIIACLAGFLWHKIITAVRTADLSLLSSLLKKGGKND